MEKQEYLVIYPSGDLSWMEVDGSIIDALHKTIGCEWVENVRTILPDINLIVDECGKIKDPPQPHNELASRLYYGWLCGMDDICGPAVVAAIHLVDGESDWCPLSPRELYKVCKYLQISDLPPRGENK